MTREDWNKVFLEGVAAIKDQSLFEARRAITHNKAQINRLYATNMDTPLAAVAYYVAGDSGPEEK
jgi:hypothetical protein